MGRNRVKHPTLAFASSEVPLYYQLSTILREQIRDGTFAVGDQLPTEAELVAEYGISRITVRQALKALEEEALIRREPGRGTFVTARPRIPETIRMDGSSNDLALMGQVTSVKLLDLREVAASQQDAETFAVEAGAPVIQCVRLRFHHSEPFSYTVNRLPKAIGERFEAEDWETGSIMRTTQNRLGLHLRVADQTVRATLADASIARWLEIRIGSPLLAVDRVVRTDSGGAVARAHTCYRSDIFSMTVPPKCDESMETVAASTSA